MNRFEKVIRRSVRKLCVLLLGSNALEKSLFDRPFEYALKLRTGEVIAFEGAKMLRPDWVRLDVKPMSEQPTKDRIPYPAGRGIDVRIADIVWVMDAPEGH